MIATAVKQEPVLTDDFSSDIRLKKILVPTDFSSGSRQALPYAINLARRFGGAITLIYVVPSARSAELNRIGILLEEKALASSADKQLAEFAKQELPPDLDVDTLVLRGGPPYEIDRAAARLGIDLIVTATHGYTGLQYFAFGSTVEGVVRHAPCPVLAIPQALVPIRFPGVDECAFKRIVAPISLSTRTGGALHYAAALSRKCGGEITLLHAIHPRAGTPLGFRRAFSPGRQLEAILDRLLGAGIKAHVHVCQGKAFREITECARQQNADLIVISSHTDHHFEHFFLTGTAERVVRHASCPVLVVRSNVFKGMRININSSINGQSMPSCV
jgi:nucleotide-binding universal stress UspA family protein